MRAPRTHTHPRRAPRADLGYELTLQDIETEPLVPATSASMRSTEEIVAAMAAHDEAIAARVRAAVANGCVLRYVASLTNGDGAQPRAALRLVELPVLHPFAALSGSSIAVAFYTKEHAEQPLVISGQISLTSCVNALYSDLIRLARTLDTRARDRGPNSN